MLQYRYKLLRKVNTVNNTPMTYDDYIIWDVEYRMYEDLMDLTNKYIVGRSPSLAFATEMLYEHGYKVHTYRRSVTTSDKVKFDATVLCFTPKQDD